MQYRLFGRYWRSTGQRFRGRCKAGVAAGHRADIVTRDGRPAGLDSGYRDAVASVTTDDVASRHGGTADRGIANAIDEDPGPCVAFVRPAAYPGTRTIAVEGTDEVASQRGMASSHLDSVPCEVANHEATNRRICRIMVSTRPSPTTLLPSMMIGKKLPAT